jgi:hypothetical protein
MKPPRIRLRSLMIIIAISAIATWGYTLWRRSAEYASKAEQCEVEVFMYKENLDRIDYEEEAPFHNRKRTSFSEEETIKRNQYEHLLRYAERLGRKYRRAARFPWLPVEPDPPPPGR